MGLASFSCEEKTRDERLFFRLTLIMVPFSCDYINMKDVYKMPTPNVLPSFTEGAEEKKKVLTTLTLARNQLYTGKHCLYSKKQKGDLLFNKKGWF